jgi:UDP-N-acetylglucosamine 2-epimerase (non-hydrolysing)
MKLLEAQLHGDRISLLQRATCVVTDVWHVQEQAAAFGINCITIGKCFAQAATVANGTNTMIGLQRDAASQATLRCMFRSAKPPRPPPLWNGKAALRIAGILNVWLESTRLDRNAARQQAGAVEVEPG